MQEEAGFLYWIWDGRDVQSVWDKSELSVFFVVFFAFLDGDIERSVDE